MQARCYLFHAYLELHVRELWKLCRDGAFLAYIQEKKMEEGDEVKNVLGSVFYRK